MDRWSGKIAVVTGASSGIGAAVVQSLLRSKLIVVGLARRVERVEALKDTVDESLRGNLHAYRCDVSDPQSIERAFTWIESEFQVVNILINNAGISKATMILADDNSAALDSVIDTNLRGLIHCTKAAYRLMNKHQAAGHIVNVNSVLGHSVFNMSAIPASNIYPATKYGVTAATEVLRQELNYLGNDRVKVSSISPGFVKTEIVEAAGFPDAEGIYQRSPHMLPEDVAEAIEFMLSRRPNVQVHELIMKPVGEKP